MQTDSTYIQHIMSSGDYNYLDEIEGVKATDINSPSFNSTTVAPDLSDGINKFSDIMYELSKPLGLLMVIAIIAALVWQLKRKFSVDMDTEEAKGMGEDTIYNHDWHQEIKDKYSQGKYSEVVVLAYLYKLKMLNDEGVIKFASHKTPGMFENEVARKPNTTSSLRQSLHWLTNQYLRVRYGHKTASESQAKEALALAQAPIFADDNTK